MAPGEDNLRAHRLYARSIPELESGPLVGYGQVGPRFLDMWFFQTVSSWFRDGLARFHAVSYRIDDPKARRKANVKRRFFYMLIKFHVSSL